MSTDTEKVNLFFRELHNREMDEKVGDYPIIRLMANVVFMTNGEWTLPETSIVDTGAHTSLLPYSFWKEIKFEEICEHKILGISNKPECRIPVLIGKVWCRIIDEEEHATDDIEMHCLLAETDEVPFIIGFKDILANFPTYFNFKTGEAYLELT